MKRVIDLTVDIKKKNYNTIFLKQMDTTVINVKILDDNEEVSLASQTVDIIFTKPDYTIVEQAALEIDTEKGTAIIQLLPDCLRKYGKANMEIEIKNTDDEVTSSFYIPVQIEKTSKDNVKSDNTPNYIESMQKAIDTLRQQGTEMLEEYNRLIAAINTALSNLTTRGHVYGIKRKIVDLQGNKNTSTQWTKIFDNVGLVAQAQKGSNSNVQNDYDNLYPWNKIISINRDTTTDKVTAYYGDDNFKFDGSNGDVLTRIPKMWMNRLYGVPEADGYYEYRLIADFQLQDSIEFIEIEESEPGRYKISVDSNGVAHSISGAVPKYNANIKNFYTYAKARGENHYTLNDWRRFVIETLYLVEYADNNMQNTLGQGVVTWSDEVALLAENNVNRIIVANGSKFPVGRTICIGTSDAWNAGVAQDRTVTSVETYSSNGVTGYAVYFDGDPVNIAITNHIWGSSQKSGGCDSLGMKSGCLVNDGRHSMIYRGFEDIEGNDFEFAGGFNIKDYQSFICYDPAHYGADIFDETYYHKLGYKNPENQEGYIKAMGYDKNNPLIALPTELGASTSTGYCDYCYSKNSGNRVALVGGGFDVGAGAGLFCWHFNHDSSGSNWGIGARLLRYQ